MMTNGPFMTPPHKNLLLAGCCLSLLGLAGCGGQPDGDGAAKAGGPWQKTVERIALPVQVIRAEAGTISDVIEVQARLEASQRQEIVSLSTGMISSLPVVDGQLVEAGEVLLQLSPLPEDADAVINAENALTARRARSATPAIAGRAHRRGRGPGRPRRGHRHPRRRQLELAKAQRDADNRTIKAPFSGVISGIEHILGERLDKGTVFARLQNLDSFTTQVPIPETIVPRLQVGLAVDVRPLGDESAEGKILTMPAAIDEESGSGLAQITITEAPESWRPGAFALMRIKASEVEAEVVLPRICVQYRRNRAYVWEMVPEAGADSSEPIGEEGPWMVQRAWVELGAGDEDRVVVREGLRPGAMVVRDGSRGLSDKVPVVPQGLEDYAYVPIQMQNPMKKAAESGGRPGQGY